MQLENRKQLDNKPVGTLALLFAARGFVAKPSEKYVLLYLISRTNNRGECFPKIETMAYELDLCKRVIQYRLRTLERREVITTQKRGTHNYYRINLEAILAHQLPSMPDAEKPQPNESGITVGKMHSSAPNKQVHPSASEGAISDMQRCTPVHHKGAPQCTVRRHVRRQEEDKEEKKRKISFSSLLPQPAPEPKAHEDDNNDVDALLNGDRAKVHCSAPIETGAVSSEPADETPGDLLKRHAELVDQVAKKYRFCAGCGNSAALSVQRCPTCRGQLFRAAVKPSLSLAEVTKLERTAAKENRNICSTCSALSDANAEDDCEACGGSATMEEPSVWAVHRSIVQQSWDAIVDEATKVMREDASEPLPPRQVEDAVNLAEVIRKFGPELDRAQRQGVFDALSPAEQTALLKLPKFEQEFVPF